MQSHKLRIGFYGPSTVCWVNSENSVSFIDQIRDHFDAQIVNVGVPQGSAERILFELKKTKHLDIAIVFHTVPRYVFVPKCSRDLSLDCVKPRRAGLLWTESNPRLVPNQQQFEHEFLRYGGIADVFDSTENFVDAMTTMREYFYHPDLQLNRYQGAMLAIDSYLSSLQIPVFQSIVPKYTPQWLMPSTGTIDHELSGWIWVTETKQNPQTPNNLTPDQNRRMAARLIEWIKQQRGS